MPCGRPRREFRSPMTSPTLSSGTLSVTSMIGSSSTAPASPSASFIAIEPAVRNACSDESSVRHAPSAPRHAPDGAAAARTPAAEGEFHADEAVIVTSQRGLTTSDPGFARRLRTLAADIRATRAGRVQRGPVSRDGRSALLLVELRGDVEPVVDRVAAANGLDGFRTLVVGGASIDEDFSAATEKDLSRGETFGLALALLVLVGVFGSLVAALVPIAVAAASIVVALAAVALVGQAFELNFIVVNV